MTEETKKSKGASKLSRSEITTVRLDPKLRYLAELAARKQRRTLSSFIEWAIEDTLNRFALGDGEDWNLTLGTEASMLWDVDQADRFVKLALRHPDLLTHDEQILWKLIKENGSLWRGQFNRVHKGWEWEINEDTFSFERLRQAWPTFVEVAAGEQPRAMLPKWHKTESEVFSGDLEDETSNLYWGASSRQG